MNAIKKWLARVYIVDRFSALGFTAFGEFGVGRGY